MNATTTSPATVAGPSYAGTSAGEDPATAEYLRAPATGTLFGLTKQTLYRLAYDGQIRSALIRQRGKLRGTRLFHGDDVRNFIRRQFEEQNPAPESRTSGPAGDAK